MSNQIIGKIIEPRLQLSILNINPKEYWVKKEEMNDITEYKIARPGSGLSLELIY